MHGSKDKSPDKQNRYKTISLIGTAKKDLCMLHKSVIHDATAASPKKRL